MASAPHHPSDGWWTTIVLIDGRSITPKGADFHTGGLQFRGHGAIGAFPGFTDGSNWYPLHAVVQAIR